MNKDFDLNLKMEKDSSEEPTPRIKSVVWCMRRIFKDVVNIPVRQHRKCLDDFAGIRINDCCRITCPINFNLFTGFTVDMHGSTMFLLILLDVVAEL